MITKNNNFWCLFWTPKWHKKQLISSYFLSCYFGASSWCQGPIFEGYLKRNHYFWLGEFAILNQNWPPERYPESLKIGSENWMIFGLLFRPIFWAWGSPRGVLDLLRHGNGKSEQGVNVSGRICERISQDCTDMEDSRCLAWAHPPTISWNSRCLEPPRASRRTVYFYC